MKRAMIFACIVLCAQLCLATTIHVPTDQPTIQAGIDAAVNGDTVLVAEGVYSENLIVQSKGIWLTSSEGADKTTILPLDNSVPTLEYKATLGLFNSLCGFEFSASAAGSCVRSREGGRFEVTSNRFHSNSCADGALHFESQDIDGYCAVRHNLFASNSSTNHGGALRLLSSNGSIVESNVFRNNSAAFGGGIDLLYSTGVNVKHNLFVSDSATHYGGAVYAGATSRCFIINNTIDSCVSTEFLGGGIVFYSSGEGRVYNNIVTNCAGFGIKQEASEIEAAYNNCYANLPADYSYVDPGTGAISVLPGFLGGTPSDYHLLPTSSCIDAGHPDSVFCDLDGSRNDMGAFPFLVYPVVTAVSCGPQSQGQYVFAPVPQFQWVLLNNVGASQAAFEIEVGTDSNWSISEMWSSGVVTSSEDRIVYAGAALLDRQTYYLRIRAADGAGWGKWRHSHMVTHFDRVIDVTSDSPSIQSAIDAAVNGDTVLVEPGWYTENLAIHSKGITLISSGGAAVTAILPLDSLVPTLEYSGDSSNANTLQGFTFTNSRAWVCVWSEGYGRERLSVIANRFIGNKVREGTLFLLENSTVRGNWFEGNICTFHGGGLRLSSNPNVGHGGSIVEDNMFLNNSA